MARKPKKINSEAVPSSGLLKALKFISLITKDIGPINETHVSLQNNTVSAFNGVLSAGHKIIEDINACPQNKLLIEALSKCGDNLSITQLDNTRLSIKSNKFKAIVPCVEQFLLQTTQPDPKIAIVDNRLKYAFEQLSKLNSEDGQRIVTASILMNGYSLVATTGTIIFEAWHGIHLPSDIAIPKSIIQPLIKTNKNLVGFGFSPSSVTFHFEDESWIKTQNYAEHWPDIGNILDLSCNAYPPPPQFFEGLAAVGPFSVDGNAYFGREVLQSHSDLSTGASFEMPGLPAGPIYPVKSLMLLKDYAKEIDFLAPGPHNTRMLKFYGDSIRGVVAGQMK